MPLGLKFQVYLNLLGNLVRLCSGVAALYLQSVLLDECYLSIVLNLWNSELLSYPLDPVLDFIP